MDIQYAILGLLNWQPLSGYDLKKIIAESDLFYWSGNNNQIYNSLVQLHREGLVTQSVQLQESLPARKIYTLTPAGKAALRQAALSAPELPEIHSNFQIQLALAGSLSDAEIIGLLKQYEAELVVQIQMRAAQAARPDAHPGRTERESYLWQRLGSHGIELYRRELEWVRDVRQGLPANHNDKEQKNDTND